MDIRPFVSSVLGLLGFSAWAVVDGVLGTLAALLGVVAAAAGLYWSWRVHRAKMTAYALDEEKARLEIERLKTSDEVS